jgi:hypothetical protein
MMIKEIQGYCNTNLLKSIFTDSLEEQMNRKLGNIFHPIDMMLDIFRQALGKSDPIATDMNE